MADRIYVVDSYWQADYVGYQADAEALLTNEYYIDEGYYVDDYYLGINGMRAQLTADLTQKLAIELDPLTLSSEFTQTSAVGTIKEASASLTDAFTPTLIVNAITNTFAVLDATASVQVTGVITAERTLSVTANFAQTTDNARTRDDSATLATEFTFLGLPDIITPQGQLKEFAAAFEVAVAQSTDGNAVRNSELDFYVDAVMAPDGVERIRPFDSTLSTEFTQTADSIRTRDESASLITQFALDSSAGRIQQASATFESAFSPSMTVNVVINTFAVLDSTSALATVAIANRSADIALASIINLSSQGDKFAGYAVDAQANFAQTANNVRTRDESATVSADFAMTTDNSRIRDETVSASAQFELTANNERTHNALVAVSSIFTTTIAVNEIVQLQSNLSGQFTQQSDVGTIKQANIACDALFTPAVTVNATTNTFAVLDSVATMAVTAVKTPANTINMSSAFAQNVVFTRVKDAVLTSTFGGVNIQDYKSIIAVDNSSSSESPVSSSKFAISFWAQNPEGVIIDTTPIGQVNQTYYSWGGNFEFIGNTLYFESYMNDQVSPLSYSNVTWTIPNKTDWHHYLIDYQVTPAGDQTPTTVKRNLYVDGVLVSNPTVDRSVAVGTDGKGPGPDSIALYDGNYYTAGQYWPQLLWSIGSDNYSINTPGYNRNYLKAIHDRAFTGSISQIAVWYGTVPDFAQSIQRSKLYDTGYQDLGVDGTATGLSQPNLYFRLNSASDIAQRGSLLLDTYWYQDPNPQLSEYLVPYTFTPVDSVPRNNVMVASMNILARGSNSGFIDYVVTSTLEAEVLKLHAGDIELTADTQLTANNNKFVGYTVSAEVDSFLTADAVVIAATAISLQAQAQLVADNSRYQGFEATLSANFAQTVQTDTSRIRFAASEPTAQADISASPLRIKQLAATLQLDGSVLQVTSKIGSLLVTMDASFALQADPVSGIDVQAQLILSSVQTADAVKTVRTTRELIAQATTAIEAKRLRDNIEEFDANFAQTTVTTNSRIVGVQAQLQANFTQTAQTNNSRIRADASTQLAEFTQTVDEDLFKRFAVTIRPEANAVTHAVKTVRPPLAFASIATELVAGRAISYDRNLTLFVKREYRTLIILEESTLLKVAQETRVNMVRT